VRPVSVEPVSVERVGPVETAGRVDPVERVGLVGARGASIEAELELVDASVVFPGAVPVRALWSASTTVWRQDSIAVIGRSGSGKSTLLNVLGLLDRPTSGTYLVRGEDTRLLTERGLTALRGSQFGFVFQAHHLLADRTSRENVEVPLMYRGIGARERRAAALAALSRVGLSDRSDAVPATLSGGERQRVNIARALAQQPRVLLCDEPTGALDLANAEVVVRLLEDLNRDGLTVIVVTHDRDVADVFARQWSMSDGIITELR
jgi:putative ABC transport system ATP-binding protein